MLLNQLSRGGIVINLQTQSRLTAEDYLAIERSAEFKSEFFDGNIFAMSGASEWHNIIFTNTLLELGNQIKKRPCKLYANDMRVKVSPTALYNLPRLGCSLRQGTI